MLFRSIFAKVDLGPLERAASKFFALLDRPDVMAALQKAFEWVVDVLATAIDYASQFVKWLADDSVSGGVNYLKAALMEVKIILGAVVVAAKILGAPFYVVYDIVQKIAAGIRFIKDNMPTAGGPAGLAGGGYAASMGPAANDNGVSAGKSLIDGLISGISAGTGAAAAAAAALGRSTYEALRAALDVHSPSRKGHFIGAMLGAGVTGGVEESAPKVAAATARMVEPPAVRSGGKGSSSRTVTVGDIHINGVKGAEDASGALREELTRVIEQVAQEAAAA